MKNKEQNPGQEKRITLAFGNGTVMEIQEIKKISSLATAKAIIVQAIHILFVILQARKDGYRRLQMIKPDEPEAKPIEIVVC